MFERSTAHIKHLVMLKITHFLSLIIQHNKEHAHPPFSTGLDGRCITFTRHDDRSEMHIVVLLDVAQLQCARRRNAILQIRSMHETINIDGEETATR